MVLPHGGTTSTQCLTATQPEPEPQSHCPDECKSPLVADGGEHDGGVLLEGGVCFAWSSHPYSKDQNKRYCGPKISTQHSEGQDAYTKEAEGGYVACVEQCYGNATAR